MEKRLITVIIATILIASVLLAGNFAVIKLKADSVYETQGSSEEKSYRENDIYSLKFYIEENADTAGWIKTDSLRINCPVMYTPEDTEYYLHRSFNREYSLDGLPFIEGLYDTGNTCILIRMGDGKYSEALINYREADYLYSNENVIFKGSDGGKTYKIFACADISEYCDDGNGINLIDFTGNPDEARLETLMNFISENSAVNTGEIPEYGCDILILTAESDEDDVAVFAYCVN